MSNQNNGAGRRTFVEEGTQFKGSLTSTCPVEVKGAVEGDVAAPALTVSANGSVRGKVRVAELRSEGELAGEFDCDVVQLAGVVKDNTVIRAKSLAVKLSPQKGKLQVIFGECELEVGDPTAQKNVAEEPGAAASTSGDGAEAMATADDEGGGGSERRSKRKSDKGSDKSSDKNGSVVPPPPDGSS